MAALEVELHRNALDSLRELRPWLQRKTDGKTLFTLNEPVSFRLDSTFETPALHDTATNLQDMGADILKVDYHLDPDYSEIIKIEPQCR